MKNKLHYFMMLFCLSIFASAQLSPTTFSSKNLIANTGDQPYRMVSGDFNSDGHIDLIVTTYGDNTIELYSNDGSGNFSLHSSLTNSLNGITNIKLAQINTNTDSHVDIVACSYNNDKVVWFANDAGGGGNFSIAGEQVISIGVDGASGLAVGTIDAGPTNDIAVSALDDNTIVWFSNDGTGTFTGPNTIDNTLTSPDDITLFNVNPGTGPGEDSDLDLIVATGQFNSNNVVEIFNNDGTGTFTKRTESVITGLDWITQASPIDYDGDSFLDIIVAAPDFVIGSGALFWLEDAGTGDGFEFNSTPITTSLGNPAMSRMADLDADGNDDLIVANGAVNVLGDDLIWFKNNGGGSFGSEQVIDATQSQIYVFEIADFDNDTYLDIASSDYNFDQLNWFENLTYPLGIDDKDKDTFGIYPNPTFDKLNFSSTNSDDFNISIYDLLGKRVMEATKNVNSSLDISTLDSGIYILKLNDFNKTYKFIKQ